MDRPFFPGLRADTLPLCRHAQLVLCSHRNTDVLMLVIPYPTWSFSPGWHVLLVNERGRWMPNLQGEPGAACSTRQNARFYIPTTNKEVQFKSGFSCDDHVSPCLITPPLLNSVTPPVCLEVLMSEQWSRLWVDSD